MAAFCMPPLGAVAQEAAPADLAQAESVGTPPIPAGDYLYIAGMAPSVRPAGAPIITEYEKSSEWYAHALRGVSEPYPASLRFLEDQGAWWTPFIHPGMTGPYDIRGLHAAN